MSKPPVIIDVAAQIAEVERGLQSRRWVYPKWVASSRMKATDADRRLRAMEAVLASLKAHLPKQEGLPL